MRCVLSICIPTYNRPDELLYTLSCLLPQMQDGVELIILDNASEIPGFNRVRDAVSEYDGVGRVELKRNLGNIGGNANILRCIEEGTGEWVWLLGDDDIPGHDAISKVLTSCGVYCNAAFIHFHTPHDVFSDRNSDMVYSRASQLLGDVSMIGELLFMSNCVLRRSCALKYLVRGYHAIDSMMPHMAVMLWSINENDPGVLASSTIVRSDFTPHPSTLSVCLSKGLELEWPDGVFAVFQEKISSDFRVWANGRSAIIAIIRRDIPIPQGRLKILCLIQRLLWVDMKPRHRRFYRKLCLPFVLSALLRWKKKSGPQPDHDKRL